MKGFVKKLMLASSLLILTVVLLTYVFVLYFEAMEETSYKDKIRAVFSSSLIHFNQDIEDARFTLDALTVNYPLIISDFWDIDENAESEKEPMFGGLLDAANSAGYEGIGVISIPADFTYATVDIATKSGLVEINITQDTYRGFDDYIMFSALVNGESFFFYGKKADKQLCGYDYFVLVTGGSPLVGLKNYDADNYVICDNQGVTVAMLFQNSKISGFENAVIDAKYFDFGNEKYLVFSSIVGDRFEGYSLVSLTDYATIKAQISEMSLKFYIFMAIASLLMIGFFVAFITLIKIDKAISGTGEYRIDVDAAGNIIKTDGLLGKRYKKLVGNISNYVEQDFSDDCVIICAETVENEKAFLNCKRNLVRGGGYAFMASDATELYKGYLEFRLDHFTDDVTEMRNIQQLEIDFENAITGREKKTLCFIIYELGIDRFLAMYGLEFYKKLLKILADRVREVYVSQAKTYYLTGDRFVVLVEKDAKEAQEKIDSAIEFIAMPARIDDLIIRTVCKAGFLLYSENEEILALPEIISRAELALSYAKSSNKKNHYGYVDSIMRSKQTLTNEDIRQIIQAGEVSVCFQPQYSLEKKCIVGFEALTRLSGKYSYINPGVFIENVEQTGAMVMLGDYIMEKSMKFASTLEDKNIKISVNVSPVQLLGEKFVERFLLKMSNHQLLPSQIGIEITETYEMSSIAKAQEKLREIQRCGVSVGIDDFGEKYSSLRYIKNLPIDFIKIDKGFVDDVETDRYSGAIVEMIISLAKRLSLYTTVEGVETISQVRMLENLGADLIQGYIISAAVDEETAKEYILTKKNLFD